MSDLPRDQIWASPSGTAAGRRDRPGVTEQAGDDQARARRLQTLSALSREIARVDADAAAARHARGVSRPGQP